LETLAFASFSDANSFKVELNRESKSNRIIRSVRANEKL
jgi:hypothetical protein